MKSRARKLAILDVGHGNCAVLQDTRGVTVIDVGRGSHLLEYLNQEGIRRVETVLVSHADEDHIGGLIALLGSGGIEVNKICLNSDASKKSKVWDDLLWTLDRSDLRENVDFRPCLTRGPRRGHGEFDQGPVRIEVLGPSPYLAAKGPGGVDRRKRKIEPNSISAVIRLLLEDMPLVLLPGDLDEVGLDDLLQSHDDFHAPILVYPHHGGRSRRTDPARFARQLCECVRPETVIFSIGRRVRGRFSTPRPEVVEAVRQVNPHIRIACTQLSEQCAEKVPNFDASHLSREFSSGRETRSCCAGTLVLDLENPGTLSPPHGKHLEFIHRAAPRALCRRPPEGSTHLRPDAGDG